MDRFINRHRKYILGFSAGYLVCGFVTLAYVNRVENEKAKMLESYKRLYEYGNTIIDIIQERNPELFKDSRIDNLIFDNIIKDF